MEGWAVLALSAGTGGEVDATGNCSTSFLLVNDDDVITAVCGGEWRTLLAAL